MFCRRMLATKPGLVDATKGMTSIIEVPDSPIFHKTVGKMNLFKPPDWPIMHHSGNLMMVVFLGGAVYSWIANATAPAEVVVNETKWA